MNSDIVLIILGFLGFLYIFSNNQSKEAHVSSLLEQLHAVNSENHELRNTIEDLREEGERQASAIMVLTIAVFLLIAFVILLCFLLYVRI